MPASPVFQATLGEWRTVLEALRHYRQHLERAAPRMSGEDGPSEEGLVAYDHLERLEGLLPKLEAQLQAYLSER